VAVAMLPRVSSGMAVCVASEDIASGCGVRVVVPRIKKPRKM